MTGDINKYQVVRGGHSRQPFVTNHGADVFSGGLFVQQ